MEESELTLNQKREILEKYKISEILLHVTEYVVKGFHYGSHGPFQADFSAYYNSSGRGYVVSLGCEKCVLITETLQGDIYDPTQLGEFILRIRRKFLRLPDNCKEAHNLASVCGIMEI